MAFAKKSKEERREEVQALLKKIEEGVASVKSGDDWANMLKSRSAFHKYSFGNQMLIAMQRPGASHVAGFDTWKNKLGRMVNKGEKGIRILAPVPWKRTEIGSDGAESVAKGMFFKTVVVFDVAQTSPIPGRKAFEPPNAIEKLSGDETLAAEIFAQLARHAEVNLKVPVTVEACAPGVGGYYSLDTKRIVIAPADAMHKARVLAHELAHATLHAQITDYHAHRGRYEVEAESVAFCVMHAAGVDAGAYAFPYVAHWADKVEMVRDSMERIAHGVKLIMAGVGATVEEAEELVESAAA